MSVAAVEKAFALLEFLAQAGKPSSLADVTSAAGMPKPTAYRLLKSLQALGYVSRPAGSRDYLVGPRAARLSACDPHTALKTAARPVLQRLHGELNETVNLGVLSGSQILYLDFVETTQPLRFIAVPGQSDPYFCTALGRAIASQLSDERLETLLAGTILRPNALPTPLTVRTKGELKNAILKARETGIAEEFQEAVEGVSCLAVSLAFLDFPEAAISVAVPVQRLPPRRKNLIVQALKSLAEPL